MHPFAFTRKDARDARERDAGFLRELCGCPSSGVEEISKVISEVHGVNITVWEFIVKTNFQSGRDKW